MIEGRGWLTNILKESPWKLIASRFKAGKWDHGHLSPAAVLEQRSICLTYFAYRRTPAYCQVRVCKWSRLSILTVVPAQPPATVVHIVAPFYNFTWPWPHLVLGLSVEKNCLNFGSHPEHTCFVEIVHANASILTRIKLSTRFEVH